MKQALFLLAILASCELSACATVPYVWVQDLPPEPGSGVRTVIEPGDRLQVVVDAQERLSGEFLVHDDGTYSQAVIGSVRVSGLTPDQAALELTRKLTDIVVTPHVSVALIALRPLHLSVLGEVKTPGAFEVPYDASVLSVIARSGGLTEFADHDSIYVVRRQPRPLRIRLSLEQLTLPSNATARFRLKEGDVIVIE